MKLVNAETEAALIKEFNDVLEYIKEEERIENLVPATDKRRISLAKFEEWFKT